ncbi:uncharacterized protein ColSpa_10950 [Colletotrichum spaethianum]|uniref:DUF4419 domain-containing protein n=1 Tax=Colletotrichum spaethianum TaxID=700344 RepID=A0AA37PEK7_9PEZI|nr:uncharacterized protein ColSpa_10950 [Colletotrichum spaethianum]GKT50769.1 uncharacterized protein ColSpa_10950 [Colletotrichum spaethianum]
MPVTLNIVNHPARPWEDDKVTTPEELFERACPRDFKQSERLIQTSLSRRVLRETHTSPSKNGLIWAAYHAYSNHHHLTLRPEDIWFAILTQLSFYINANAEDLRSFFVDHKGNKELEVIDAGSLEYANFGAFAQRMTHMIAKNVKDPELRTWVMPSFSTTTDTDRVVASVLFMGAMQKYFSYGFTMCCGIPSVTLLGEVADYQEILARLDKMEQLGDEPTQFAEMLRPILRHMILSFHEPTSPQVAAFWNKIATREQRGSGMDYMSGWISAFCYWSSEGKARWRSPKKAVLDGVSYPLVDFNAVPDGICSVPVTVDDNGDVYSCTMLAGSFGIQGIPEAAAEDSPEGSESTGSQATPPALTNIRPLTGWLMYENKENAAALDCEEEESLSMRYEPGMTPESVLRMDRGILQEI